MNRCVKCTHQWYSRQENRPKVCPVCKARNWDGSLVRKNKNQFSMLNVGDSLLFEWPDKNRASLIKSLSVYMCRTKRRFAYEAQTLGLFIRRIM